MSTIEKATDKVTKMSGGNKEASKPVEVQAADAIHSLLRAVNIMGSHNPTKNAILEALSIEHRAIQQDFMNIMFGVIAEYSKTESYDGRNENAVLTSKRLTQALIEG